MLQHHFTLSKNMVTQLTFTIVLVSFLLSTFVSLWSLSIMSQRNTRELSRMMAARIYDSISSELNEPVTLSLSMARNSFLIEELENEQNVPVEEITAEIQEYLAKIRNSFKYESVYVISDATRRYYNFDEQSHGTWAVFVDTAIRDDRGKFLGVCGVGMHMSQTHDLFLSLEKEHKVKILLIDTAGQIQVDTKGDDLLNEYENDLSLSPGGDYVYHDLSGGRIAVSKYLEKLDWYLVVESDGKAERGEYFNVILLNIASFLFVMLILILTLRIISMRTLALANASLQDQDTQLLNRRAFEEEKANLMSTALEENFVYVTVDINGLKTANDTRGHAAGDELIRGTADCLRKCFGRFGKIFRIGGDEFAAMLHISEAQLDALREELDKAVDEWEGERIKKLSVSCGYASSREFPSVNIAELSQISDERMYAAKAEYYRTSGIDRRKT